MKDIKAIRGRQYIQGLVAEGEHEHQDFKFAITDARKIARSISAFANRDGGRLLVGVKDNGVIAGVRNEEDIFMVESAAEHFCNPPVKVEVTAFRVDEGVVVLRVVIPRTLRPPVTVREEGGVEKAYYRVADENFVAPPILVSAWEHYSNPDGTLLRLDQRHHTLLRLIEREGAVTIEQFIAASHLPTEAAVDIVGRLAAASVVEIRPSGHRFLITL